MNWLAHVFLSENNIEHQLGNLLADPLKGRAWEEASPMFRKGLETHKRIDSFTDSHPLFKQSKSRLKNRKYLKAVVIDIVYDHLLTIHWHKYASKDFSLFTSDFRTQAPQQIELYPNKAKEIINRVVDIKLLSSYSDLKGLGEGFKRIDRRLSDRVLKKESTFGYLPLVEKELVHIERDFLEFFPELMEHVETHVDEDGLNHWVKS
jgi:acyl carrier protein phosphodiesterase